MNLTTTTINVDDLAELVHRKNSLDSGYVAFLANKDLVLNLARLPLEKVFRRVILDPVHGLVMLMSPSATHEQLAEDIDTLIKAVVDEFSISRSALRANRWRRSNDPENTGLEPDCCYYLGPKARAYRLARAHSVQAGDNFVLNHAPDLVVEVGITSIDKGKQAQYRELGVAEHWQVNQNKNRNELITVTFLALQHPEPRTLAISGVLPGLRNKDVEAGLLAFQDPKLSSSKDYQQTIIKVLQKQNIYVAPDSDREPGD